MAKELDTSWFDLKNYDELKTMSTEGWIWQLMARVIYHKSVRDSLMSHDEDNPKKSSSPLPNFSN